MKAKKLIVGAALAWLFANSELLGQGAFQNLDFESAALPTLPAGQYGSLVPVSAALPHWTVFIGTNQITEVLHNNYSGGAASVSILGPGWTYTRKLDGDYTLLLQPGVVFPPGSSFGYQADVSVSQVGLVPEFAKSIRFKSGVTLHHFAVTLGGQAIPAVPLELTPQFRRYGVNVSSFAGQTQTIVITALPDLFDNRLDFLDSIEFSPEPIPEPTAWVLLAVSGALVWLCRRRTFRRC